jgi:hypothetical protein
VILRSFCKACKTKPPTGGGSTPIYHYSDQGWCDGLYILPRGCEFCNGCLTRLEVSSGLLLCRIVARYPKDFFASCSGLDRRMLALQQHPPSLILRVAQIPNLEPASPCARRFRLAAMQNQNENRRRDAGCLSAAFGSFMSGKLRWAVFCGISVVAGVALLVLANRRRAGLPAPAAPQLMGSRPSARAIAADRAMSSDLQHGRKGERALTDVVSGAPGEHDPFRFQCRPLPARRCCPGSASLVS